MKTISAEHAETRTYATAPRSKTTTKQDYGTPWDFIRAVESRFGPVIHDLACTRENAKAVSGYYFDEGIDALQRDWLTEFPTGNLWLNPPFAEIAPWAAMCSMTAERCGYTFLLTPASIGSEWFAASVHNRAQVFGLRPRITFDGTSDPYPKDLMLSVFGFSLRGFDTWRWKR